MNYCEFYCDYHSVSYCRVQLQSSRHWLIKRNEPGFERTLLREFCSENEDEYRKFLRMTAENFDELLDLIDIPKTYFFPQSQYNGSFQSCLALLADLHHWRHGKGLGLTGMSKEQKNKLEKKLYKSNFFAQ